MIYGIWVIYKIVAMVIVSDKIAYLSLFPQLKFICSIFSYMNTSRIWNTHHV